MKKKAKRKQKETYKLILSFDYQFLQNLINIIMHLISTSSSLFIVRRISFFSSKQSKLRLPSFQHFPLHNTVFKYLEAGGIHTPTYSQYALLSSLARNPHQVHHLTAPTGSGKTLSYLIPISSSLKQEQEGIGPLTTSQRPRAIVITSTKQLVLQCRQVAKGISHHCKLKVEGMGIGRKLSQQKKSVQKGVDVLISTQSKIKWLLSQNALYLTHLKWLVLDQVDTLFQTARLQPALNLIVERALKSSQGVNIVLTGTTSPLDLKQMIKNRFENIVELVDKHTHMNLENIKHEFVHCPELDKHQTLLDVYFKRRQSKTLIFCNTVSSLHELQYYLQTQGINALTLHSQLHKKARLQNYQLFRDGKNNLLISTDLGARGLDIPHLQKVINYDFPLSTVDYLQRAGRTGRAGQSGQVVTLYHKKNLPIIDELKDCSFDKPVKVLDSAYRMKNRQAKRTNPSAS